MHAGNIFAALMAWLIAKSQGGEIVLRIEDLDRARSKRCYIDQVQNDFELLGLTWDRLMAWLIAKSQGGEIVLRIEDLDRARSKRCYIDQVQNDFELLGLTWDRGPFYQHDRDGAYEVAYELLNLDRARSKRCYIDQVQNDFELLGLTWDRGPFYQHDRDGAYEVAYELLNEARLVYPCFCTRADLHAASAPHRGEKLVYPGTCRFLSESERDRKTRELLSAGDPTRIAPAMRLCVDDRVVSIDDVFQGRYEQRLDRDCGDFLVRRTDGAFAYQLAVVVDDAAQGVNSVVRGIDLLCSSPQQAYLQDLLGLPRVRYAHVPQLAVVVDDAAQGVNSVVRGIDLLCSSPQQAYLQDLLGLPRVRYAHVPLFVDESGRRLAKRSKSAAGIDLLCSSPQQAYLQDLLGLPRVRYAHVPLFVDESGRRLAKRSKSAAFDELLSCFGSPAGVIGHIAFTAGLIECDEPATPDELLDAFSITAARSLLEGRIGPMSCSMRFPSPPLARCSRGASASRSRKTRGYQVSVIAEFPNTQAA